MMLMPTTAEIPSEASAATTIAPEEPEINIETSKKKGKGSKNRGRFFNNAATPEKQFAKDKSMMGRTLREVMKLVKKK